MDAIISRLATDTGIVTAGDDVVLFGQPLGVFKGSGLPSAVPVKVVIEQPTLTYDELALPRGPQSGPGPFSSGHVRAPLVPSRFVVTSLTVAAP